MLLCVLRYYCSFSFFLWYIQVARSWRSRCCKKTVTLHQSVYKLCIRVTVAADWIVRSNGRTSTATISKRVRLFRHSPTVAGKNVPWRKLQFLRNNIVCYYEIFHVYWLWLSCINNITVLWNLLISGIICPKIHVSAAPCISIAIYCSE